MPAEPAAFSSVLYLRPVPRLIELEKTDSSEKIATILIGSIRLSARCLQTNRASSGGGPMTAGRPVLKIPAFLLRAIAVKPLPRFLDGPKPTELMTQYLRNDIGRVQEVANPYSIKAKSTSCSLN